MVHQAYEVSSVNTKEMKLVLTCVGCSGYICISLPEQRLQQLEIPMMVPENQERHKTAYTVTVDAKQGKLPYHIPVSPLTPLGIGTTTGISAHDRALTARLLADPAAKPEDFTRPGHMVPLRYTEGGVLARPGHTEAATGTSFHRFFQTRR